MQIIPEDFTYDNYYKLLLFTKNNYSFTDYHNIQDNSKFCIWRHDVDISLTKAFKLSEIERQLNVSAIYFIQLSSTYYNLLDLNNINTAKQIINNGHKIGLHFDSSLYKISNKKTLIENLIFEKNILEKLLNIEVKIFSFHNPSEQDFIYNEFEYSGMINTYSKYIKENIAYCSDSNGFWRHKRLEDFLKENNDKIQVLTHPVWWTEEILLPREKVVTHFTKEANNLINSYDEALKLLGRLNIGK